MVQTAPATVAGLRAQLLDQDMPLPHRFRVLFSLRAVATPEAVEALLAGAVWQWAGLPCAAHHGAHSRPGRPVCAIQARGGVCTGANAGACGCAAHLSVPADGGCAPRADAARYRRAHAQACGRGRALHGAARGCGGAGRHRAAGVPGAAGALRARRVPRGGGDVSAGAAPHTVLPDQARGCGNVGFRPGARFQEGDVCPGS